LSGEAGSHDGCVRISLRRPRKAVHVGLVEHMDKIA
jgi:hypothetical protein